MFIETLIACRLPYREMITIPTSMGEGIWNFLFGGHYRRRVEVPEPSTAATLSRLIQALRAWDSTANLRVLEDTTDLVSVDPLSEEDAWGGVMPEAWERGLAEGRMQVSGSSKALEYRMQARLLDRVDAGEPTLRLVFSAASTLLFPRENPDPRFESDLMAFMSQEDSFVRLERHLRTEGQARVDALVQCLKDLCNEPPEFRTRVILVDEACLAEPTFLHWSEAARRSLVAVGRSFGRVKPALQEVYRQDGRSHLFLWRGQEGASSEAGQDQG